MKQNHPAKSPASANRPAEALTTIFVSALFLILPLAVHDTFHDATGAKHIVFCMLSGAYLLALGCICLARLIRHRPLYGAKLAPADWFFVVFLAAGIAASLLSGYAANAVIAHDNRYQGIVTMLLYGALFLALRRYGHFTPALRFFMLFAYVIVCTLGILNQLQLDPLGYISALIPSDHSRFTSTIGNIGFYGAYCVLLFPIPLSLFLRARKRRASALYAAITLIGLFGTMAASTESSLMGLLTALLILPMLCPDEHTLKRYFYTLPALILAMQLYAHTVLAFDGYSLSRLTRLLLSYPLWAAALAVTVILALLARKWTAEGVLRVKRAYQIVLFSLLGAGIAAIVLINLFFADAMPPLIAKYAVITPEWGTDRGRIWQGMMKLEADFSPMQLAIGGGSGCVARWDIEHRLFADAIIDSAHNEYLHYLATHGIIGLAAYLAFIGSSVSRGLKRGDDLTRCYVCGCIAYAVQATVNIAQPFTTPMFLALMFLLPSSPRTDGQTLERKYASVYLAIGLAGALAAFAVGLIFTTPA